MLDGRLSEHLPCFEREFRVVRSRVRDCKRAVRPVDEDFGSVRTGWLQGVSEAETDRPGEHAEAQQRDYEPDVSTLYSDTETT
ncbi:hypothetical protein [Haladaptatus halobius]|uniref:hypothetical protein n=1 Tax=Haladaptatus halobius TaxID=2884875 RepID=UPI001D0B24FC|nr:hypothetical protein [Haladaptatus halobius]